MKIYNIKSNEDLFDKWTKLVKKTSKKISPQNIVQNDMEATSDQLNEWFKQSLEDIRKVDEDFKQIVADMLKLRQETVKYLKAQIDKQGDK